MRRSPLAMLGLLALFGAAGPAHAAADLGSVTFTVMTSRVENVVRGVTASVEVIGERILRAAITPPGGTLVEIPVGGAGFRIERTFTTEAELATAFPDGTYLLTLNGSTNIELDLARPPVALPAISAPLSGEILAPGPVTVEFAPCSICDEGFDSTEGLLLAGVTKLVDPMTSSTTGPVKVTDAQRFPLAGPFEVLVGSERLTVSRLDAQQISVIERGVNGTTAAAHAVNDTVSEVIASDDALGRDATLVQSMTSSTTGPVEVTDAQRFPLSGPFEVLIGSERLSVSRLDDQRISVIARGLRGTTAAAHAVNDTVSAVGQADTGWKPAIELETEGSFTAVIVHTAVRGIALVGPGSDDFTLVGSFSQQDAVPFFTGAAVPGGTFCVVVDDDGSLDPAGDCFVVEHPAEESGALLDPSGTVSIPIGGIDMEYTSEVLPSGEIVGSALADLDGNGSMESTAPLSGKLGGVAGKVQQKLLFTFLTLSPAAKLAVKIGESGLVTDGSLAGKRSAKGTVLGARIKDSAPSTLPLGEEPLGWRLDFEVVGKQVEIASVELTDGRTFALTGRFLFDFLTGFGKLALESAGEDAGVSVRIEDLEIDDSVDPPVIDDGVLIYKILGQRGRFPRVR